MLLLFLQLLLLLLPLVLLVVVMTRERLTRFRGTGWTTGAQTVTYCLSLLSRW